MHIYKLEFSNGDKYVGITTRVITTRLDEHCYLLSKHMHHSYKMQECYRKCNSFPNIELIETVDNIVALKEREVYWIDKFDTFKNGLNCTLGGEYSPNTKLEQEDYHAIVCFLAITDMTCKEISEELELPYSIVNNISSGYTHQYLHSILPYEYSKMLSKIGTRSKRMHEPSVYHQVLLDLVNTCDTHKIISDRYSVDKSIVSGISSGNKHKYLEQQYPELYKKLLEKKRSRPQGNFKSTLYTLISPEGSLVSFTNISKFSREYSLDKGSINRLVHNKAKSVKGWRNT